jgi:hypothetical protein
MEKALIRDSFLQMMMKIAISKMSCGSRLVVIIDEGIDLLLLVWGA